MKTQNIKLKMKINMELKTCHQITHQDFPKLILLCPNILFFLFSHWWQRTVPRSNIQTFYGPLLVSPMLSPKYLPNPIPDGQTCSTVHRFPPHAHQNTYHKLVSYLKLYMLLDTLGMFQWQSAIAFSIIISYLWPQACCLIHDYAL